MDAQYRWESLKMYIFKRIEIKTEFNFTSIEDGRAREKPKFVERLNDSFWVIKVSFGGKATGYSTIREWHETCLCEHCVNMCRPCKITASLKRQLCTYIRSYVGKIGFCWHAIYPNVYQALFIHRTYVYVVWRRTRYGETNIIRLAPKCAPKTKSIQSQIHKQSVCCGYRSIVDNILTLLERYLAFQALSRDHFKIERIIRQLMCK